MNERMPPDQAFSVAISLALKILAAKSLVYLSLAGSFVLFCWAMASRDWISLATAATFAFLVFLPVMIRSLSKPS